jgi:hypothetical protein
MVPKREDQGNLSHHEKVLMSKDVLEFQIKQPVMKYPIRVDAKTVIFPRTKKRYEKLSRQYPSDKTEIL